jgi:hypothetical protein
MPENEASRKETPIFRLEREGGGQKKGGRNEVDPENRSWLSLSGERYININGLRNLIRETKSPQNSLYFNSIICDVTDKHVTKHAGLLNISTRPHFNNLH